MRVRAASGADAERVALFRTAVRREAYAGLVPQIYLDRVGATHRGTDLADRLLEAALGDGPACLWVFADPRARASCARHGFAPDGASAVDPDPALDEVRLVRG